MKYGKALDLADILYDIQRLARTLDPLIEEGREEFDEFRSSLARILEDVFPTYSVAFTGPVNSGKSTLLSSLLQESGDHPIASISPSNETFAPMVITYGKTPSLLVRHFSIGVLQDIDKHLSDLQQTGGSRHEVAQYKEIRNNLQKIEAVVASELEDGILRKIDLSGMIRPQIIETINGYIAQSSGNPDVYGVYKVELTFPGKILRKLNNVRFVDLFGFGEPSPLINMKYTRFISEEALDAIVYVFPDRAISDDFYRLFEIPRFLEEIVVKKRLFLVLNKADAYPDVSPSGWHRVKSAFRRDLAKHVPVLQKYVDDIPVFVLSAASIDGQIGHRKEKAIRSASLKDLHSLRDQLRDLAREIEMTSSDPSIYLASIFDLLDILDLFAVDAEQTLGKIEDRLPEISRVIDTISSRELTFEEQRDVILGVFRTSLESELERCLEQINYEEVVRLIPSSLDIGEPRALFRAMVAQSHEMVLKVYADVLERIFVHLGHYVDEHLMTAYREYVSLQDDAIQSELEKLKSESSFSFRPLSSTVNHGAKDLLHFSKKPMLHHKNRELLSRFASWFLRNQCEFDAGRGLGWNELYAQIKDSVQRTVETFMLVYVCENPELKLSYLGHICTAGEPTYWNHLTDHVLKLDEILSNQVKITKWKFGLYQNKIFFVSHKKEFSEYAQQLLKNKQAAQRLVLELI